MLDLGGVQIPYTYLVAIPVALVVAYLLYDLWRTYIR